MKSLVALLFLVILFATASADDEFPDMVDELRTVAGQPRMQYYLVRTANADPPTSAGFNLLVVLPGGDGSADFHPFVRRIHGHALDAGTILVQPIAVKWTDSQQIVWPTDHNKVEAQQFSTEDFVIAIISEVSTQFPVNPKRIHTLSWSSSGPAAYALALRSDSPVTGSMITMSVFKPQFLPPLANAAGRRFYIEHSPDDPVCPYWMARSAADALADAAAIVTLRDTPGGHGWHGDVFGRIRTGMDWLASP
jgi:predicted esterase